MQYGIQALPARVDLCTYVLLETSAAVPLTLVTSLVRGAMSVIIIWGIASNALMMATVSTMLLNGGITCHPNTKVLPGTALNLALTANFQPPFLKRPTPALWSWP